MKIWAIYSHLNWQERMLVHRPELWNEILNVIDNINLDEYRTKISQERTMQWRILISPTDLNKAFKDKFAELWRWEKRTSYRVTDDYWLIVKTMHMEEHDQKNEIIENWKIPIRSYNQTDFEKSRVAIEVQFWKYSFIAYDLFVKHLAFYVWDTIDVWVEILPMKSMQSQMSSWPWYYEWALYDLARQGRWVPSVPLILIWIE